VTIAVLIIIALVIVVVGGLLFFNASKKAQTVVPDATDPRDSGDRVVGTDDQGNAITAAQEAPEAPRDDGAFESLLQDEIHDRGMKQPPPDEQV
jgi:hypothetical protein